MALTRAHDLTGKRKYLDLARYFIAERGRDPKYFENEHKKAEAIIAGLSPEQKIGP